MPSRPGRTLARSAQPRPPGACSLLAASGLIVAACSAPAPSSPPPRAAPPASASAGGPAAAPPPSALPRAKGIVVHEGRPVPVVNAPTPLGGPEGEGPQLRGLVYLVEGFPEKLPDLGPLRPFAALFASKLDAPPTSFSAGLPGVLRRNEWFAVRYDGSFTASSEGSYRLRVESDDGSRLYVDGVLVVDNDGLHGMGGKSGDAHLGPGPHALRLDYLQGPGFVGLQLFVTPPRGGEQLLEAGASY